MITLSRRSLQSVCNVQSSTALIPMAPAPQPRAPIAGGGDGNTGWRIAGRRLSGIMMSLVTAFVLVACDGGGETAQEHLDRALEYREQGKFPSAVIELKNVLQMEPDHAEARWLLGRTYVTLGDGLGAEKELGRARQLGYTHAEMDRAIVRALLLQRRFEDALKRIGRVSASSSDSGWLVLRGEAQLGLKNVEEAENAFRAALADDPGNNDARRGLIQVGLMGGDATSAEQQLNQALETAEDDVQAWLLKGQLELSQRKAETAQASFEKALSLDPGNPAARISIAQALLAQGKANEANEQIEALAKISPNHPLVNYLRALVARLNNDLKGAQTALRQMLQVVPNHAPSLLLMGEIHYLRREFEQAQDMLNRHLRVQPDNLDAKKLLAAVYIRLNQPQKALYLLGPMAAQSPDDPQLLAVLGIAHMGTQDFKKSQDYLGKAAELAPDAAYIRTELAVSHLAAGESDDAITELEAAVETDPGFARADVLLIMTHFRKREFDKALTAAQKLADKQPSNAPVLNLLGAAYEGINDYPKARESYKKALQLNPEHANAALNLARMDLRDGKRDEARAAYESVLDRHKDHPVALVALARIVSEDGRIEEGITLLERARKNNPQAVQPRLILANYYLRTGDAQRGLALAAEAHEIAPQAPATSLLLGSAQLASGKTDDAISTFFELASRFPKSPEIQMQLAIAYGQKRDTANTRRALEQVLELQPAHPLATLGLGNLALNTGRLDEAMTLARQLQTDMPNSPAGYVLEGDVMMARGDPRKAGSSYRAALDRGEASNTVRKLYAARAGAGDPDASETLTRWLDAHPEDVMVRLSNASRLHQQGDKPRAISEYQRILELDPSSVLALNNLAWLYHENGDKRALELAQRAYNLAPERAEVIDTFGWLLVQEGRAEQGLALLEKAVKQAPNNDDIRYHLAAAVARTGDSGRAKRELRTILDSGREFSEKPAAEALFQQLN